MPSQKHRLRDAFKGSRNYPEILDFRSLLQEVYGTGDGSRSFSTPLNAGLVSAAGVPVGAAGGWRETSTAATAEPLAVRQVSSPTAILTSLLSEASTRKNSTRKNLAGRSSGRILDASFILEADVTVKETVRALLDRLPNDCSLEDVLYHLYVVQAVDRGRADAEAGRVLPHEQVAAELRRKWLLGSAT